MRGGPRFGDSILVGAQTVRVIGRLDHGVPVYRQSWSTRDAGRYVRHEFPAGATWPGLPLGFDRVPAGDRFELEPDLDERVYVRLRRLPQPVPEVGLVVGYTWKEEGVIRPGRGDDTATLTGPARGRIALLEVAMPSSAKARIVLVHEDDARVLVQGAA